MIPQPTIAVATNRPPTDEFLGTRLSTVFQARMRLAERVEPSDQAVDQVVGTLARILLPDLT